MKPKHHFWSSLAAGGALYWATGSSASLAGAMMGGFLIDADHILDQLWSIRHGAPLRRPIEARADAEGGGTRAWFADRLRPRKLLRLPLIFHSYELLAVSRSSHCWTEHAVLDLDCYRATCFTCRSTWLDTIMSSVRRSFTCSHTGFRMGFAAID